MWDKGKVYLNKKVHGGRKLNEVEVLHPPGISEQYPAETERSA